MNVYNDSHPAPCYGCTKRWVNEQTTCHGTCEAFKEFQAFREKKRKEASVRASKLRDLNAIGRRYK